ncbi:hypothetical protein C1645_756997 [Glomus cerebriforme]|uniref:CCHC-type domain-containing protein n=1 Tax=Glomus cerebriforme TaxID=658196 RepID=A0A397TKY3_9GLOM|nr:hypothetical protein C1645_756997 [Glomus cerebriforme]
MAASNNLNIDYIYIFLPNEQKEQKSRLEAVFQQAKALQNSVEAQNKLIMTLQTQISLPIADQKHYTAKNVALDKHTNWFVPTYSQQKPCYVCHYFGHFFENCPNIHFTAYSKCIRCWQPDHTSQNCSLSRDQSVRPPFKSNFLYPNELLDRIFNV